MKKLKICIDIDGTITDPYYWLDYANEYFKFNVSENQITSYDISKVLDIDINEYIDFYEKFKFKMHSQQKLRDDVKDILNLLYEDNYIYFVTARDKSLELLTFQYLKHHNIQFDGVFVLGTHNKVPKARDLKCDIFIEDSYENALQLSHSGFKVLLMNTNYNKAPLNDNIIRVYNWKEILEILTCLSKEIRII